MASSYVRFRGERLRVGDATLQIWLHLMLGELPETVALAELRAAWGELAQAPYSGWLSPGFDERLSGVVLSDAVAAAKRVAQREGVLSRSVLQLSRVGGDNSEWTRDVDLASLREDFLALQHLLEQGADPRCDV